MNETTEYEFNGALEAVRIVGERLNYIKNEINSMPGLLVFAKMIEEYQKEACESESLSEHEFEEKYGEKRKRSEQLGRNGWVISPYASLSDIEEWENLLDGRENEIVYYFEECDVPLLDEIIKVLKGAYIGGEQRYFELGLSAFESSQYMTAAMYFFALLDYRIGCLVEFPKNVSKNREKYSKRGFVNQKEKDYVKLNGHSALMSKKLFFIEMYPSLIEYLNRAFCDGEYCFKKKNEPPYLNRNWLMHGRMKRDVERYECIQILNAISVIEFMFGEENENED